ncbi:MAG: hypothetical protein NTV80_16785 [Verrucomicrobia bacterium]|nr:hypothetical protein [Verrucomicrobiota bacterium]
MKSTLPRLALALFLIGLTSTALAEDPVWITDKDLIKKAPTVAKPAIVMFGEKRADDMYLPVHSDQVLNARFETTVFLIVSNLDGLLADVSDPADPYWKAWRQVSESDKDGKVALAKSKLDVDEAKTKLDVLAKRIAEPETTADQVKELGLEVQRLQLTYNDAQTRLTELTLQVSESKDLVKRGFKDLSGSFRLRLGGETFGKLVPADVATLLDSTKSLYLLTFNLRETNKDNEAWLRLLKNSPLTSVHCDVKVAYINSAGHETVVNSFEPFNLRIPLFRWPFWTSFSIIGACLFLFIRNIRSSEVLRDPGILLLNRDESSSSYWHQHQHPLSMARLQMSIWFFIIIGSFVFLWSTTGSLAGVNVTAMALMGISSGTSMFSAIISQKQQWDASKRAPITPYPSQIADWFADLLSDESGITIHRFQMLAWTLVLSVVFINGVIFEYAMPVFTKELLGLMGISSGVYVGFKIKEGNDRGVTPENKAEPQ